jgi:hypothetical protein
MWHSYKQQNTRRQLTTYKTTVPLIVDVWYIIEKRRDKFYSATPLDVGGLEGFAPSADVELDVPSDEASSLLLSPGTEVVGIPGQGTKFILSG